MSYSVADTLETHYARSAPILIGEVLAVLRVAIRGFGDLDRWAIYCEILHRTLSAPALAALPPSELLTGRIPDIPSLGANMRSIAESLGLPRETVRRKVARLIELGWVERRDQLLFVTGKAMTDHADLRAQLFASAARVESMVTLLRDRQPRS